MGVRGKSPSHGLKLLRLANALLALQERVTRKSLFHLTEEEAVKIAVEETDLTNFGGDDFQEDLRMLCGTLTSLPAFTPLARLVRRTDIIQRLKNRLYIQEAIRKDAGILQESIESPWFILGLPRTGTTLLHRLLAQDPAHRAPLFWEANTFYPQHSYPSHKRDPRIERAERNLRLLDRVDPEFKAMHEMRAELPEECLGFLANGLVITVWTDLSEKIRDWAESRDMTNSYQLHKQHLQILQYGSPARTWILKSPIHLLYLDGLLKVYPDARIIQTHRDPVEILPSAASFLAAISRTKYFQVDLAEIGQRAFEDLAHMLAAGMRAREKNSQARFVDISYPDLMKDPLGVVAQIYNILDTPLSEETRRKMENFLAANPQHKWGRHRYALEDFGLEVSLVRKKFAGYTGRFLQ